MATTSAPQNVHRYKHVGLQELPGDLKVSRESNGYLPQSGDFDLAPVHQELRGRDDKMFKTKDSFATAAKETNRLVPISRPVPAVLAFQDDLSEATFGQLTAKGKHQKNAFVQASYNHSTQWPHIRIRLLKSAKDSQGRTALLDAFVYSDALETSPDPKGSASLSCLTMKFGQDVQKQDILQHCMDNEASGVAQVHEAGKLWLTRVGFNSSRPAVPVEEKSIGLGVLDPEDTTMSDVRPVETPTTLTQPMTQVSRSNVKFNGISTARISELLVMSEEERTQLSDAEKIVHWLSKPSCKMFIHTRISEENISTAKQFAGWFRSAMKVCMDHGPLWFYRLESNSGLPFTHHNFPTRDLPHPRWMVERWDIGFDDNDVAIRSMDLEWSSFKIPALLPSPEAMMFAYKLCIMREREQYELIVRDGWLLGSLKVSMKFRPFPGVPGQYLVCIWGCNASSIPTKLPSLESRILISSVFDEDGTASSFSGVVCEDLLNTKAHVLACVRGDSSLTIGEDAVYPGFILQVDEEAPTSRMLLGLQKCSELKNADGVDVANALAIREPTVKNPGCLSTEFRSTPEMRQRYRGVMQRADIQLNNRQKGTVEGAAHSSTGLYAICGSPGTGKTHISCVITEGLAQCGKSTAYVTPASDARDEAIKMFLGITNLAQDQIVRFVGDYKHGPRGFGQDHQPEDLDLFNDVWELYKCREQNDEDDPLGKYDFYVQLDKYIAAILQDDTHVLFNDAKAYDSEKHELWLARLLGSDRAVVKALRNKLDQLRTHKFAESYLQSRCKVIFLADSQAAAENIVRCVKVQCLVIDDAGMFTAPRMAVPLGGFKDGLELLVLAGDPKQKPLPISSSKTNEFAPLLETSVLQRLHEKGSSAVART